PGLEEASNFSGISPFLQIIKLDPIDDEDEDALLNYEEFGVKSSPYNPDTDNDGLLDGEEVHDYLTNPTKIDSDDDGLDDKYEVEQGYNAVNNDTDSDLMLDYWEDFYNLDPIDNRDAKFDFDSDGLSNLGEFQAGTDPKVSDTDGDGMGDGYEVEHGLDPLRDDTSGDHDGDFLPNKFEHDYGLNPDSPIETIIAGLILVTSISAGIYYIVRLKRLTKLAKEKGYIDRNEMKETEERGFTNLDERKQAEAQGFITKSAQTLIHTTKEYTVEMMIEVWKSQNNSLEKLLKSINIEEIQVIVNSTTSPINLHDVELGYKHVSDELKQFQQEFNSIVALQQSISNLSLIDDELPFISLTKDELAGLRDNVVNDLINLNLMNDNLMSIIDVRKQWFEPWQRLLTLIQMTQDGLPIELIKIAEVIQGTEDQAENLLELLLEENTMIGKYDGSKRVYTKGTNISQYIQSMLEKISGFGE
ncbi:MAG: hypothetical protein GPJ54_18010, partial [Candidatus Heimdallarchaeota archaeon]|nr:hypothetical protein [Candidatus Heimdallarchaeota archaeon]